MLGFLRDWISGSALTYPVLFGAALLDIVAIVPSETLLIAASVIAADDDGLFWGLIGLSAAAGAFVGDNLLYLLGDRFGETVAAKLFRGERSRERLDWSRRQLQRRPWVLVPARFVPGGRTATAFAAGTLDVPWRTFMLWDAVAVSLWASGYVTLGYLGGSSVDDRLWLPIVGSVVIASVIGAVAELIRRMLDRHEPV